QKREEQDNVPTGTISYADQVQPLELGKTIFDYADDLAVQVPTSCFRSATCHECMVEIKKGMEALCPRTEAESFLKDNYRLACQAKVVDVNAEIEFVPLRRAPQILTLSQDKKVDLNPMVTRAGDRVLYDGEDVDGFRGHIYGLAIDVGTTTVVMDLMDLETGESVSISSFENPQRFGGSDVMFRISFEETYPGELWKSLAQAINHEIVAMGEKLGFVRQEIYEIVVAGNATMRDLFFRLDVQSIGQKPYKSQTEHEYLAGERESTALYMGSRRLGIRVNPKARVYGIPLIASHVGGDVAADLMAVDMGQQDGVFMLVDVGTNTEVVVGNRERLIAASCPAGPAFEGGGIAFGMPGYAGAIESVVWENDQFNYGVIGDVAPEGLCGSGLIDLLAELRRHDLMAENGAFRDSKQFEMAVVPDRGITFSREDASNLAQAKAANYCGQLLVMQEFGVTPDQIDRLYLAGGFANYVNVKNAIDIGFLAPVPEDRIEKVGNAAIHGAREVLLSKSRRVEAENLVKDIEHIELETKPNFFDAFVDGCQFKRMVLAPPAP
ncbi:MAG: ASKHA domain-containing protein, partial [Candidatus Latescibacteria bacterium]|nr:ASKHA domain-containing protein [Candidatus Latescibacterota bacterium]